MARESEYTGQGISFLQGLPHGASVAPRDAAPPGASLVGDALALASGLSRLHEALTTLTDRLHGPRPRPAPETAKGASALGEPALRLTIDRALALLAACEAELAEAMGRL